MNETTDEIIQHDGIVPKIYRTPMIPNVFRNGCYAVRAATPEQLPDEGETGQTPLKPRPVESVAAANGVLEKVN